MGNDPINWRDPEGLKKFEMIIWVGGALGHAIIGVGVYDVTINDFESGELTIYIMMVVGIGIGLPSFRGSSRPVIFNEDDCKKYDSFDGLGYIGGVSVEIGTGAKIGGGIKIPNDPFVPNSVLWWDCEGFDIGVFHNITHWSH